MFEDMPGDMTAEWYYEKLKQKTEEQGEGEGDGDGEGQGGQGGQSAQGAPGSSGTPFDPDKAGQFDSHDDWHQGEPTPQQQQAVDIAKERLKEALKESATEAASTGWGSGSGRCRKEILERLSSRVDWRKVLRYFVKTSHRASKRSTIVVTPMSIQAARSTGPPALQSASTSLALCPTPCWQLSTQS